jgi:hypothetical protein
MHGWQEGYLQPRGGPWGVTAAVASLSSRSGSRGRRLPSRLRLPTLIASRHCHHAATPSKVWRAQHRVSCLGYHEDRVNDQ